MAGQDESPIAPSGRRSHTVSFSTTGCTVMLAIASVLGLTALSTSASAATTGSPATTSSPSTTAPTTAPTTTSTTAVSSTTAPQTSTGSASSRPATKANQWVTKALAAEQKVGSVRIDGKVTQGKSEILLDVLVNGDGEGGGVFVQDGSAIKVERVGTLLYFNAPKAFWASHASTAQAKTYGGKWISLPASDTRFASFDEFLNAADLVAVTFKGYSSPPTMGKSTTFAGHRAVVVKDAATINGKRNSAVMYIGTASPHYVYKVVATSAGETSTLAFNHYGKPVALTVPPEPINLS